MNQNTISKSIFLFFFCDRIEIQALSVTNNAVVGGMQRQFASLQF